MKRPVQGVRVAGSRMKDLAKAWPGRDSDTTTARSSLPLRSVLIYSITGPLLFTVCEGEINSKGYD